MRKGLFLLLCCIVGSFNALEAQNVVQKDSLSISEFVKLNEKVKFGTFQVEFNKVINDSRCPKDVMCVRAGEAFVEVLIYKDSKFIQKKKLRIDASGFVTASNNLAFYSEDLLIYGFSLTPYPDTSVETKEEDYQLEVVFQPKE